MGSTPPPSSTKTGRSSGLRSWAFYCRSNHRSTGQEGIGRVKPFTFRKKAFGVCPLSYVPPPKLCQEWVPHPSPTRVPLFHPLVTDIVQRTANPFGPFAFRLNATQFAFEFTSDLRMIKPNFWTEVWRPLSRPLDPPPGCGQSGWQWSLKRQMDRLSRHREILALHCAPETRPNSPRLCSDQLSGASGVCLLVTWCHPHAIFLSVRKPLTGFNSVMTQVTRAMLSEKSSRQKRNTFEQPNLSQKPENIYHCQPGIITPKRQSTHPSHVDRATRTKMLQRQQFTTGKAFSGSETIVLEGIAGIPRTNRHVFTWQLNPAQLCE